MKKLLLGAAIALLPLTSFSATILGIQAGAGTWKHDPSGSITSSVGGVGTSADLKNDLQLSEESEGYAYFVLEHPVPLIPNFKYVNTKLTSGGTGDVTTDFTFNGTPISATTTVTTTLELNQSDYILYYEVLDNIVSFDIGLNAKMLDGKASVTGTTPSTFTGVIPMLYASAEIVLPAGFALAAEISTISTGNDAITDSTAKITYTTDFNLGIEAGVRSLTIDVDVDSVKTDMEFSGVFAGVYFKF